MKSKILFLCTGNYYRSRFAEIYFNYHAPLKGIEWEAFSKGYRAANANNIGPISVFAQDALLQRGISDYPERFPEQVTEEDLQAAHRIIALKEKEHRPFTKEMFPDWEHKIEFWHIDDIDVAMPHDALPRLEDKIKELMDELIPE
ncbi:MAG: low molecular weight phosphatase family protein [Microscillaceae bacterium]|nr:low molecular weight phosphatase family protein [Microscillaceae bacterium]